MPKKTVDFEVAGFVLSVVVFLGLGAIKAVTGRILDIYEREGSRSGEVHALRLLLWDEAGTAVPIISSFVMASSAVSEAGSDILFCGLEQDECEVNRLTL